MISKQTSYPDRHLFGGRFSSLPPARLIALGFCAIIVLGGMLLALPCAAAGRPLPFLDALFTATSALCVTGLVVVDTGAAFSAFGKAVILLLIQIGGLGFMSLGLLTAVILGKKVQLHSRILLQASYGQFTIAGVVRLGRGVLLFSAVYEMLGAIALTIAFLRYMPFPQALAYGVFHAVSAFNNAGFDLMGDYRSLTGFTGDWLVNLTVILLIILGGLGFIVHTEFRRRLSADRTRLSLHSRLVLLTTVILIVGGTLAIWLLEKDNPATLGGLDPFEAWMAALFASVSPRTAGFNTIDMAGLFMPTLMIVMALMFIGASPCSTGGGIKTSSLALIFLKIRATLRGEHGITLWQRSIPESFVSSAFLVFGISVLWLCISTLLLSIDMPEAPLSSLLFETISALSTVGLTVGVTGQLSALGKAVIMINMLFGRVGVMTILYALSRSSASRNLIRYPDADVFVG